MQEYVNVRVVQTKVEMTVTKEYYDTYTADLIHLGMYKEPEVETPKVEQVVTPKRTRKTKVSPETLED